MIAEIFTIMIFIIIFSSCCHDESYYYVTDYEVPALYGRPDWGKQKAKALEKTIRLKVSENEIQMNAYGLSDEPIIFPDEGKGIDIEKTITFIKTDRRRFESRISEDDKYILCLFVHSGEEDSIIGGEIREIHNNCVKYVRFEKKKRTNK